MKSLKKTLVLLVVFSMILSAVMPAFAATDIFGLDCEEEVARLEALKVVTGYEDGTYGPEKTITRAEMAVILCKMVGIDTVTVEENKSVPSKFSDVAAGEWYTGYINVAAGKGLLSGFPDGTFRPAEQLTMNQVLTLCVNALGRGEYVAEMGTWPANYIAEATKLGLLDGVKTSDANRGNVAIIVWNTLEAPYVWDVEATEFEGTINLMNSHRSLLSIYFRDFTYDDENDERVLKEVEATVISTPSRNAEIGDRQIVLPAIDEDFDFKTTFKKKDVKEECTYINDEDQVVAYVPEEVYEDIDSLRGKTVTVVFGKDNVVALIVVEDDIVENEFITKYAAEDNKITVGENVYKLAKKYSVTLNDAKYASLEDALEALEVEDVEDIEKKVQAQLTLDIDDKVEKVALFASATIANVSTETLVTKVKETSKKYQIETLAGDIEWSIEDEEDIDFPRVYVDGAKADIKDIVAGNVLTIIGDSLKVEDITAIYASATTVAGEATKVKKANNAITIDGEVYMPSFDLVVDEDTFESIMTTEELADDEWVEFDSTTILDNDEVTLYMNIFGEYVAVVITEDTNSYQFGVVTYISDNITWEGEDDDIAVRNIKILLADGNKTTFKLKTDTSDDDALTDEELKELEVEAGDFVMFEANSDKVIMLEDKENISEIKLVEVGFDEDYEVKTINASEDVDGKTFAVGVSSTLDHAYTSKTVIFNSHDATEDDEGTTNVDESTEEKREVVKTWDSILTSDKVPANTIAVFEEGSKKALYILVDMADYTSSDAEYAIVASKLVEVKDDKYEIDFVGTPDVEVKSNLASIRNAIDWFIKYTTSSGKVDTAAKLIDLDAFENDLDDEDLVTSEVVMDEEDKLELAISLEGLTKKHLKVEEVTLENDYAAIEFIDEVEKVEDVFAREDYYTHTTEDIYTKVAKGTDFDDTETYFVLEDGEYEEATGITEFADGTTYYTVEEDVDVYTLADEFDADVNEALGYYTFDGEDYTQITEELEANDSIGLIRLDEDNLVVIDLRNGTVEETTLDKVDVNSYVVVYNEVGVSTKSGNVVIIVE